MPAMLQRITTITRHAVSFLSHKYLPLALAPLLVWVGGHLWQDKGIFVATLIVLALLLRFSFSRQDTRNPFARDLVTGLGLEDEFRERTRDIVQLSSESHRTTACFMIELDGSADLLERYGKSTLDHIYETLTDRILIALRADDTVARLNESRFGITLHPVKRLDLEMAIQLAARLQTSLEDPIPIHATSLYVTVSIGLCPQSRTEQDNADALLDATAAALIEARRSGPSAIRVYSAEMKGKDAGDEVLIDEAAEAFERAEITAWFQPQISTDTGLISGVEILARWNHPSRGLLMPSEFLPAIEQAGLIGQLGSTMLSEALRTLRDLDETGVYIPLIGINFTAKDLCDPKIAELVKWQLDRFEIHPNRLAIEILETVVAASPDDLITRNVNALSKLGCKIDLDDFGTGHASITSIRNFPINRLKIDRSFITKCDSDPEQQRMLTAILTMAERLDLETLAEGVETVGEHALVSQLGFGHAQGFGIARPMPKEMLADWVCSHHAKIAEPPAVGGRTT